MSAPVAYPPAEHTDVECQLAEIWRRVLEVDQVGPHERGRVAHVRDVVRRDPAGVDAQRAGGKDPVPCEDQRHRHRDIDGEAAGRAHDTGQAFVRVVNGAQGELARQEMAAARKFLETVAPSGGSVELF